jgi:hypothetical protein
VLVTGSVSCAVDEFNGSLTVLKLRLLVTV